MSMLFLNADAANKVIRYLETNQYLFTIVMQNNTWLVKIQE